MRHRGVNIVLKRTVPLLVVLALATGCGGSDGAAGDNDETEEAVACSANVNDVSFPVRFLDGPELTRSELLDTSTGQTLETLFVGGTAAEEGGQFRESEGFSIVSAELVLGYQGGAVTWFFSMDENGVRSWGGCNPTHARRDQVTARWTPAGHVSAEATSFPIYVEGGACSTDGGNEITTVIESIVVEEKLDRVDVVVWTSERSLESEFCAGVGINIDAEVVLAEPLADRSLVDTGAFPSIRHDNPHPIPGTWATLQCESDLMAASVADYGADAVGAATAEEALAEFPMTADPRFEHFLMDDTGDSVVYGYSNDAGHFVATVTLIEINESWVISMTEQCGELP